MNLTSYFHSFLEAFSSMCVGSAALAKGMQSLSVSALRGILEDSPPKCRV